MTPVIDVTFEQLRYPNDWLVDPETTMEAAHAALLDMLDNPEKYKTLISKNMTVADLKSAMMFAHGKKADIVRSFLRTVITTLGRIGMLSYDGTQEGWEASVRKASEKNFTQEQWDKDIAAMKQDMAERAAKREAALAGINDPKTLDDFKRVARIKGLDSLTEEQLATFDEMLVDENQQERKRLVELYSHRYSIDLEGVAFDLIDTKHTMKGYDLFVVQFTEWLPRRLWMRVFDRAKEFGGWYSSYDKDGAITGLQFRSEAQRKEYCENVLCGGAQLADHITEVKYLATLRAGERLKFLAEKMEGQAGYALGNARLAKSNTPRRAMMQENAIERAAAKAALAKTMRRVAEEIEGNPDHILAGIRYRTDFQTLRSVRDKYPLYKVSRKLATRLFHECSEKQAKLAHGMLRKRLRETKGDEIRLNTKIVEQFMNKGVEAWWLFEKYTHRSRLSRMGITSSYELRHAQRKLAALAVAPEEEPAWQKMERELVGLKIPGFFPTPPALIRAMCDRADVKPEDAVLDPSCGKGDIMAYVVEHYNVAAVRGVEINPRLGKICIARGMSSVLCEDTLEHTFAYSVVDVVLMNPPFETGQAVDHFMHAWNNVEPGTRIVAILPSGAVTNEGSKYREFRALIESVGAEITYNPENSFKGAFRSTGVNTVMLYAVKQ